MKKVVLYFSGAGNSATIASDLAQSLHYDAVFSLKEVVKEKTLLREVTTLGVVTPLYYFGPPKIVKEFIEQILAPMALPLDYLFVIITYGGLPFYGSTITENLFLDGGYAVSYLKKIKMVDTYTPLFAIPKKERLPSIHRKIAASLEKIISEVKEQHFHLPCRLPFNRVAQKIWEGMLKKREQSDYKFRVTEQCNGCGICETTCPVENIVMHDDKPLFQHNCQFCLGCYHRCPQKAILFTKRALLGYGWYTPPASFLP